MATVYTGLLILAIVLIIIGAVLYNGVIGFNGEIKLGLILLIAGAVALIIWIVLEILALTGHKPT